MNPPLILHVSTAYTPQNTCVNSIDKCHLPLFGRQAELSVLDHANPLVSYLKTVENALFCRETVYQVARLSVSKRDNTISSQSLIGSQEFML